MTKIIFFIVSLATVLSSAKAQFSETLFYDTLSKVSKEGYVRSGFGEGKYIYLSGSSFSEEAPLPTVTKLDTSGTVIWTAIDNDNYGRFANYYGFENGMAYCKGTIKSGQRLYTIVEPHYSTLATTGRYEVWCISDTSGVLLWKLSFGTKYLVKIADFSSTELLAITGTFDLEYHVINKITGQLVFTRHFGNAGVSLTNEPDILVDMNQNVLLSWDDTCRKFRDNRLNNLLWTSHMPNTGSLKMIDRITQDSSRFIFMGRNNARAVDTLTGATVWFRPVQVGFVLGIQSGSDGNPKDFILKDSLLYVTWVSPYVGGIDLGRGFTLTAINKYTGTIRYNVAYDFGGVPPDPPPPFTSELDWPMQLCMDGNKQIYMTGSYDRAPGMEDPGNWGIMKIDRASGSKIYEATITDDPTKRSERSQGKFLYYFNGKMFNAGNLHKSGSVLYARPLFLSFDTNAVFNERFRTSPDFTVRYTSSLVGMAPLGSTKMVLFKKLGRSAVIELRNINNQLIWTRSYSSSGKFLFPQHIRNLGDTAIAASAMMFLQDTTNKMMPGNPDSLLFVRLDTLGNLSFAHRIRNNETDRFTEIQINSDNNGKTNFIFRKKNPAGNLFSYYGYMLNGTPTAPSSITGSELIEIDTSVIRITPVQHYNVDTMVLYQSSNTATSRGWLYSNTQFPAGYTYFGFRPLRYFAKIYSALKLDSVSFVIMGRDSSGQIRASRYNHRLANPLVWTFVPGITGTMYNADSSATALYAVSKNITGNKLTISKFFRSTGAPGWSFERTPAANGLILPADLKFNPINKYFIVGGYTTDSTIAGIRSSYFYLTFDSSGTIIKDVLRTGYGVNETKINVVNVLQNGTHIYGGSLSTAEWGTAGFYNSDCFVTNLIPAVTISTPSTSVCTGAPVTFTAVAIHGGNNPVYQWQVNGVNAGTNSNTFTSSTLNNNDQVKVILTSNANCIQTNMATSNVITMTVNSNLAPTVTISGNTIVTLGQSTLITANPVNGGTGPTYQWQDSTNTHSWQNISGAVNPTIVYFPALTGNKLRCILTNTSGCATPNTTTSNALTFTVNFVTAINPTPVANYGIIYYPNPVYNSLTIDSLKISDKWQTLHIIAIDGKRDIITMDITNQIRVTVNVEGLSKGVYFAILVRKQKAPAYLKFVKIY